MEKSLKSHREKKNPRSAEAYQREREKRNRSRGKQVWTGVKWSRINASLQEAKVN